MKQITNEINALWAKRDLLKYLLKSELKANYKGKYFGFLWIILDPLFLMLIYLLLVGVIFKRGGEQFPVLLFISIISWKWFVQSVSTSLKVFYSNQTLLQTVKLPLSVFPLNHIGLSSVAFFASCFILVPMLFFFHAHITLHILWFPLLVIAQAIFITGTSLLMSVAGAFFHDLYNIMNFVFRLWFYASPGLYQLSDVPEKYRELYSLLNPFAPLMESYKNVLVHGTAPHPYMINFIVAGLILTLAGFYLVGRKRNQIIKAL